MVPAKFAFANNICSRDSQHPKNPFQLAQHMLKPRTSLRSNLAHPLRNRILGESWLYIILAALLFTRIYAAPLERHQSARSFIVLPLASECEYACGERGIQHSRVHNILVSGTVPLFIMCHGWGVFTAKVVPMFIQPHIYSMGAFDAVHPELANARIRTKRTIEAYARAFGV